MINLTKKQITIIIGIGLIVIFVIGYYIYNLNSEKSYEQLDIISEEESTKTTQNVENDEEKIVVHIAGEVKNPGIVRIKEGARIADIIEMAGGLTENSNITNINLAYVIEDGQKITIPSKETTEETKEEVQAPTQYITNESGEGIIKTENLRNNKRSKHNNKHKQSKPWRTTNPKRNRRINCKQNNRIQKTKWRL